MHFITRRSLMKSAFKCVMLKNWRKKARCNKWRGKYVSTVEITQNIVSNTLPCAGILLQNGSLSCEDDWTAKQNPSSCVWKARRLRLITVDYYHAVLQSQSKTYFDARVVSRNKICVRVFGEHHKLSPGQLLALLERNQLKIA